MVSLSGLGSGLDTQSIIAQLVQLEQQKVMAVKNRGMAQDAKASSWQTISSTLNTVQSAAAALSHPSDWQTLSATSSDDTTASVSAGSGSMTGSLSFTVDQLAQAGMVRSTATMSSLSAHVATGSSMLVAAGGGRLGLGAMASDSAVTLGTHSIAVTQASAGAAKIGTTTLAATTTIDNTNNTLQLSVGGTSYNLTLTAGTYTQQQLADEVQQQLTTAGAAATATLGTNNFLNVTSTAEGAAATLQIQGGTALGVLGLTADASALHGTNGIMSVDGGANQVFGATTAITAGSAFTLTSGSGTISGTFSGGLRVGSITANNVSTGDGTLQSVVSAINAAKAGVVAAAVQVGTSTYRLQIGASAAGAGGDPNIAASSFDANAIGGLTTLSTGQDASITIGSGTGAYTVTSATNTMSNVLPGVSITLKKLSGTNGPVNVTVDRDGNAIADKIQKLIDAANGTRNEIARATVYNASTNTASPRARRAPARTAAARTPASARSRRHPACAARGTSPAVAPQRASGPRPR